MNGLRRLVKPGWVMGLLAVALFAYACFTLLAPWQLGKSHRLDERNERLTESVQADPVPIDEALNRPQDFRDREWHRVTATGTWTGGTELVLRMRSVDGDLVYSILTPFRVTSGSGAGTVLLVDRGHVPVGENNAIPPYAPAPRGTETVTARLRAPESGAPEPAEVHGRTTVRTIDPAALAPLAGVPLDPDGYLQLGPDQPGSLSPTPVPAVENGPYLSYGLQWIAFGILAPAALIYFAWTEVRSRRAVRPEAAGTEKSEPASARSGSGPDDDGNGPAAAAPRSDDDGNSPADERDRILADRYGARFDAEHRRARRRANRLDRRG